MFFKEFSHFIEVEYWQNGHIIPCSLSFKFIFLKSSLKLWVWDRQPLFLFCQLVFFLAVPMKGTGKRLHTCGKKALLLLGAPACFLFLLVTPTNMYSQAFYSRLYSPTNNYHTTLRTPIPITCQRSAFRTHSTYLWSQRHQYQPLSQRSEFQLQGSLPLSLYRLRS